MIKTPLQLGQIVMTRSIADMLGAPVGQRPNGFTMAYLQNLLTRHRSGDWGCVCKEDWQTNDLAAEQGDRILSAYPLNSLRPSKGHGENTIWIITEYDRSVTTIMLPEDY